jgi:hypothetical protein
MCKWGVLNEAIHGFVRSLMQLLIADLSLQVRIPGLEFTTRIPMRIYAVNTNSNS